VAQPATLRKPNEGRTIAVVGDGYRFLATRRGHQRQVRPFQPGAVTSDAAMSAGVFGAAGQQMTGGGN